MKDKYAKDDLILVKKSITLRHNSFFNDSKKSIFESKLAILIMNHKNLFIHEINKVSKLILPDMMNIAHQMTKSTLSGNNESICYKFHAYIMLSSDLIHLYESVINDRNKFYADVIHDLTSIEPSTANKQLAIQRVYLTFFIGAGIGRPELRQALHEKWSNKIDLQKILSDTLSYRRNLFANNLRKNRLFNYLEKTSQHVGILPPEDYQTLSEGDQSILNNQLPLHEKGMLLYQITTQGHFTHAGMHHYDVPQLCGPSGMSAMRLALANQANLTSQQMQLYDFVTAFYTIAMGAHSLDEVFIIGTGQHNHYQRGNYGTIIPDIIKTNENFHDLWCEIQILYHEYNYSIPIIGAYNEI